jgi:perosamine synthetase
VQAAIGIAQLDRLTTRASRMKRTYLKYVEGLNDLEELTLLPFKTEDGEIPQWVDALTQRRDELVEYLEAQDIFCRRFWFPLHTHTPYRLPDDEFPSSTSLAAKAFWLPSSFSLSDTDIEQVCNQIRRFFEKN